MKIAYAYFAENADRLTDGRLCVFGGDFDTVSVGSLPAKVPLSLVVKIVADPGDSLEGHTFKLDVENPTGDKKRVNQTEEQTQIQFDVPRDFDLPPGMMPVARLSFKIVMQFKSNGLYKFHAWVNDSEVTTIPLLIAIHDDAPQEHKK